MRGTEGSRVTTREVHYDVDDLRMIAHLARPAGNGPWPAVLIGHDGVGLNDYQRRRADQLAELGYLALAMDYHGGRWFSDPQEMLARVLPLLDDPERMRAIGRAALEVLLAEPGADPGRLAAVGYGAGGTIVLELARDGVELRGIAAIQPAPPTPRPRETAAIRGSVLLGAGSEDPIQAPEQLRVFTRELQAAGVDWRLNVYGGAQHAFHIPPSNPDGSLAAGGEHTQTVLPGVGYHARHTVRAWRDVLDLLAETVGPPPP
ncbi:MAG TPA: dienelactone hydrolase family protein [Pseudonocardia sp.]|jgi:dienelactone hydrolase|nr:dienelactone hydrolase family protein [Pseudonocardia sp.]